MRPFPDVVRIEPAGLCNFRCTHCPVGRDGGKRGILRFVDFVRYFEALPAVPRVLVLYHGGEPLLCKELEYMINYAKDRGVAHTVFNTNASLLSERRAHTLALAGLDEIRISFDGASPEENNAIRTGSNFEKHAAIVRAIALSEFRPKEMVIYNTKRGGAEPAQYLKDYFADCPVTFRGEQMREWARLGWMEEDERLDAPDVSFCSNLFNTFTILADGSVPMCCEDLHCVDPIGNVNNNTPLEIWQRMEERRENFANRNYPKLCQSCWVVTGKFVK